MPPNGDRSRPSSLTSASSFAHMHFFARGPCRDNIKNCGRQNEHLKNWNETDVRSRNKRHARRICPAMDGVYRYPLDHDGNNDPGDKHHAITRDTWMHEPVRSPENTPACNMDYQNDDAVTQAGNKAVPPHISQVIHSGKERTLCDLPNIIQCGRNDKYGYGAADGAHWMDVAIDRHEGGPRR
jgi:hypothetical protein